MRRFVTALVAATAFAACAARADAVDCSLTLPATVSIGNYDPTVLSTSRNVSFTVTYACFLGIAATNLTITAGLGANASGTTFDTRNMNAVGTDRLNYWLYPPGFAVTPHSSSNVWGDGSGSSKVWGPFTVLAGAASTSGTANIQVDSNQDVAGGSYSDSVVFTMTFI